MESQKSLIPKEKRYKDPNPILQLSGVAGLVFLYIYGLEADINKPSHVSTVDSLDAKISQIETEADSIDSGVRLPVYLKDMSGAKSYIPENVRNEIYQERTEAKAPNYLGNY